MDNQNYVMNMGYADFNPLLSGWTECAPNQTPGRKTRDCWVLHFIESGTGIFEINGKTYTPTQGDVFVIPPFVENFYKADSNDPWNYIWIDFEASSQMAEIFTEPVMHCPSARKYFLDIKSAETKQNGRSAYLTSCLWRFAAFLLEKNEEKLNHIKLAVSYIEAQYTTSIRVSEIAKKLNLDRTYFSAAFKRHTGQSPIQYINSLRMQRAVELMQTENLSLTEIATEVGYLDIYHFSKVFKKFYGCSPKNYIKQNEK